MQYLSPLKLICIVCIFRCIINMISLPACFHCCDKKLRSISIRPRICHRQNTCSERIYISTVRKHMIVCLIDEIREIRVKVSHRECSPGPVCFNLKFSSGNLSPYMDSPPRPSPRVKSPP